MYELNKMAIQISKEGNKYFVCHGEKIGDKITIHNDWKYEIIFKDDINFVHKYGVFEMRLRRTETDLKGDGDIAAGDGKVKLFFAKIN